MPSPALTRNDVSPEMAELLRAGVADHLGFVCLPGQVVKNYPVLREAEQLGYVRFINNLPWITDEGRAAIGEPSQAKADRAKFIEMCSRRKRLVPDKLHDVRTDFDYRAWKAMDWRCTLVFRQPDSRPAYRTTRVGRTVHGDPQFLGDRNSQIQPESTRRFVLTVVPGWMTRARWKGGVYIAPIFSTYPAPIDEIDPEFSDAERATWDRLRQVCITINSRIRNAGRKRPEKFRYGESA